MDSQDARRIKGFDVLEFPNIVTEKSNHLVETPTQDKTLPV